MVIQQVKYVNQTETTLNELLFVVEPNEDGQSFWLKQVEDAGGETITQWQLNGVILRVALPEPIAPGEMTTLTLDYEIAIPSRAWLFGATPMQLNLGNAYPFVPPYRSDVGWMAYQPGLVGEHQSYDFADYTVSLTIIGGDDLVLAASAPTAKVGAQWEMKATAARNITFSLSPAYEVQTDTFGHVTVHSYAFPQDREASKAVLRATGQALELYQVLFGPYPSDHLSVVEALFPDGMEFDGMYFLGSEYYAGFDGTPYNYLTAIAVHETAHQWWYALLNNDQAMEPWLDETLATYSELLYYEYYYPDQVDWWWNFRVNSFAPANDSLLGDPIYKYGHIRPYINATYLRGAQFMQDVREIMGDDAFFAALQTYALRYRHQLVTSQDFFRILDEFSQADISPLLEAYFGVVE